MQYRQIEIDVDVNRWIESKRVSFDQTHNDILRVEARLPPLTSQTNSRVSKRLNGEPSNTGAWSGKGATLPAGTRLRMSYNGKAFTGMIESSGWLVNGGRYVSPSAAAGAVTGVSLNGWVYWQVQLPGTDRWKPISEFRTQLAHRRTRHGNGVTL
jgi:hypothetical protein